MMEESRRSVKPLHLKKHNRFESYYSHIFISMLKELQIGRTFPKFENLIPNKTWVLKSDAYKSFYKLHESCIEWDVDMNPDGGIEFDEISDFEFFYFIFCYISQTQPNQYIVTKEDVLIGLEEWGIDMEYEAYVEEKNIKEIKITIQKTKNIIDKLKEHSK